MFNTTTFRIPKLSKKQQVLQKHGYYEKFYRNEIGETTRFLVKDYDNPYDAIANINEGIEGPDHYTDKIVMNPGETFKEFFLRLGWIDEDGNIL